MTTTKTSAGRFNIVGRRNLWLAVGLAVICLGFASVLVRRINWGLDFTGGASFEMKLPHKVAIGYIQERRVSERVRSLLAKKGLERFGIQISEGDVIIVRTQAKDERQMVRHGKLIKEALEQEFSSVEERSSELIGPVIGKELTRKAILAVIIGEVLILLYLSLRFEFRFAVAAVVALLHDLLLLIGFMSLFGIEVDSSFVAVLLTVVGYSVNDTVVVLDRIRENRLTKRGWKFADVVNYSLIETFARSINTGLLAQLTLIAILLIGSPVVKEMAASLLIGITSGTYSSIFIAAPLVVWWHEISERRQQPWKAAAAAQAAQRPAPARAKPSALAASPKTSPEASPMPIESDALPEEVAEREAVASVSAPAPSSSLTKTHKKRRPAGKAKRRRRH